MESDKDNFETKLQESISNPKNMGEMKDADAIGTVGNADCGDMVRMFLKFDEENGQKVINKASFQSFGCQTAIAVASMATEILKGKTIEEAKNLSADEMTTEIGSLPPMKIHCGQMVEGALKSALDSDLKQNADQNINDQSTLTKSLVQNAPSSGKIIIVPISDHTKKES